MTPSIFGTLEEVFPPYRRIYFDANILIRAKWPRISQTLRTAITTASYLSIPVVLLEGVERELAAHFRREFSQARTALNGKARELNMICEPLGLKSGVSAPSDQGFIEAYNKACEATVAEVGLSRSAPDLRATVELFEMAIHKQKPFGDKGKNFQDAVILLSAIDDLSSAEEDGAFVSRDAIFDQSTIDHLCASGPVSMTLFADEIALTDDMRRYLKRQIAKEWNDDKQLALSAVNENLSGLQHFVDSNLEIPARLGFSRRIVSISRIEIRGVSRVETPAPWDRRPKEPVTLTVKMQADIHAVIKRPPAEPEERVKVGPKPEYTTIRYRPAVEQETVLERTIDLELRARFNGSRYVDLKPLSVAIGTPAVAAASSASSIGSIVAPPELDV